MKKHSAFSLIELSIVVLIIGVLIAGVTQSTRLVKQARLRTARALTQSSPVTSMTGLLAWYETSLENSLVTTPTTSPCTAATRVYAQNDADEVLCWSDNNSQVSLSQRLNASATTGSTAPHYFQNIFNGGIPAVRFDGGDSMPITTTLGALMVGQSYTMFVVEQKRASATTSYFFGDDGTACASTTNPCFGYVSDQVINLGGTTTVLTSGTVAALAYSTPLTRIHTGMLDTATTTLTAGKRYWYNGGAAAGDASDALTTTLTAFATPTIGKVGASALYFTGDIAEIIIFNRALKTEERLAVEAYLGKKYGVSVAIS
jgi:prepilin-type N-terminal cleavage/methylation domain-containing protein